MSNWATRPLSEVLEFREGPGVMAKDFHAHGIPLIRLAGLKPGAPLLKGCNFLDPVLVAKKWGHFRTRAGDVLLSTSASLGEVAVVDEISEGSIPYTGIIGFRPLNDEIDAEFIRFLLTAPSFKAQIEAMGVGSVMKHFGPMHLRKMFVSFPEIGQQRAIAEVLGALDDKIAANAKVIASTDSLAQAQFHAALHDAQPQPLSNLAEFINGKAFTKAASGTGRVVVRIAELNSGIGNSTVFSDASVDDKHVVRPGDILFAWSGSLTLHRWFRDEAIVNQHIFKVTPSDGTPDWLIYELLRNKLEDFKMIAANKATTMGHIQRKHLDEPVLVPNESTQREITPIMDSLWRTALNMERENLALAATREVLFPQMMSGKLRVKEAEEILAAAV